jgi:hypothetical protein
MDREKYHVALSHRANGNRATSSSNVRIVPRTAVLLTVLLERQLTFVLAQKVQKLLVVIGREVEQLRHDAISLIRKDSAIPGLSQVSRRCDVT